MSGTMEIDHMAHLILEPSPDVIQLYDSYGNCLYASPSSETVLGFPPDHFIGANIYDILRGEPAKQVLGHHEKALDRSDLPMRVANQFELPDGTMIDLEASVTFIAGIGPGERGIVLVIARRTGAV